MGEVFGGLVVLLVSGVVTVGAMGLYLVFVGLVLAIPIAVVIVVLRAFGVNI